MKKCKDNESVIQEKRANYRRYCKCGHSVTVAPVGAKEYFICSWCGGRIYRDLQKQKEYNEKCARNEFRFKFMQFLRKNEA